MGKKTNISEMIIQCRKRDSNGLTENDLDFFDKKWAEYKSGFGDIKTDYWIGLEEIYNLTKSENGLTWRLEVGRIWQKERFSIFVLYLL